MKQRSKNDQILFSCLQLSFIRFLANLAKVLTKMLAEAFRFLLMRVVRAIYEFILLSAAAV